MKSEDECTSNKLVIDTNECTSDRTIDGMINDCGNDCGNDCTNDDSSNYSNDRSYDNTSDRSVIDVDDYVIDKEHVYDRVLKYVFKDANISMLAMILNSMTPEEIFIKTGIYMFCESVSPYKRNIPLTNISCFMYLLKRGLYINEPNNKGDTPLHLALKVSNTPAGRFIIKKGGNINAKNDNGNTPLHLYVQDNGAMNRRLMRLILESDYDFNSQNENGDTPLHLYFSSRRYIDVRLVDSILERNYNVNIINNKQQTALHIISKFVSDDEIVSVYELFLKRGFNIKAKDHQNDKCYHHLKKNLRNRIRRLAKLYTMPEIKEPDVNNIIF